MRTGRYFYFSCMVFLLVAAFSATILIWMFTSSGQLKTKDGEMADESDDDVVIRRLQSMGYLPYVVTEDVNPDRNGVILYDKKLAYDGLNVYVPKHKEAVYLLDMQGNTVHKWSVPGRIGQRIFFAEVLDNGSLLALASNGIMKLDWDSNVMWKRVGRYHHDFAVAEDGKIYALKDRLSTVTYESKPINVKDTVIVVLSPGGKFLGKFSLFELAGSLIQEKTINEMISGTAPMKSPFHINALELLDQDIGVAKRGVLICSREQNTVAILNLEEEKVVWSYGRDELGYPHQPTVLNNGNLLIFDNNDRNVKESSRIIELDPKTRQIVWQYKGNPPESFYSATRGGNQRLPNGNTLITETDRGRVFEVTKDGQIAWEFLAPDHSPKGNKRSTIYRMSRLSKDDLKMLSG